MSDFAVAMKQVKAFAREGKKVGRDANLQRQHAEKMALYIEVLLDTLEDELECTYEEVSR